MKKIACVALAALTGLLLACTGCDAKKNSVETPPDGSDPSDEETEWTGWEIAEERPPRWTHSGIEFTAEKPVFDYREGANEQRVVSYSNRYDYELGENTVFAQFLYDFLQISKGLGGTECCILNPGYQVEGMGLNVDNREFSLYHTMKNELFVRESITITDTKYGTYSDCYLNGEISAGQVPNMIELEYVSSSNVRYDASLELRLAFGKYPRNGSSCPLYINFYSGSDCFATCYYRERIPVHYEWLYNYFKKNLFSVNGDFTFDQIPQISV